MEFIPSRKQPSSLGDILQHSYFVVKKFDHGVKKCKSNCSTCAFIEEGTETHFPNANVTIKIKHAFNCDSGYLLYKIRCKGCNDYYIGRTTCLKERLSSHKSCTTNEFRTKKVYIHIHECAKNQVPPFTIMPFLKIHYGKISEMATVENHYINWLKPGLNTLL